MATRTALIHAPRGPLNASIQLPRSKSAANRALVIASMLGDLDLVRDPGDGDDTTILLGHLRERPALMHCGAGATTFRFLLAWACCQEEEEHTITGSQRLLERPHEDLIQALRSVGADIEVVTEGLRVRGRRLAGGEVRFDSPISSQYLSALLLIAPMMERGLQLRWTGTRLSEPYVHMTLKLMAHFGVFPLLEMDGVRVEPGPYLRTSYVVPADWSAAACWYEAVALAPGGELLLPGLENDTLQGDHQATRLWDPWVETTFSWSGAHLQHRADPRPWPDGSLDLRHYPDLFQPLAATCAGLGQEAWFSGLDNLRVKETDRLKAMAGVLGALGCTVTTKDGVFRVAGRARVSALPTFDPQDDHRMAFSLAPLALVLGSLAIRHPEVVTKSYPGFWDELRKAGFGVELHA